MCSSLAVCFEDLVGWVHLVGQLGRRSFRVLTMWWYTGCTCTTYVNVTAEGKIPLLQCSVPKKLYVRTYVPCTDPVLITAHSHPMHCDLLIMIFSVTFPIKIEFLFNTILLYHNRPVSVNQHLRFVLHNVQCLLKTVEVHYGGVHVQYLHNLCVLHK